MERIICPCCGKEVSYDALDEVVTCECGVTVKSPRMEKEISNLIDQTLKNLSKMAKILVGFISLLAGLMIILLCVVDAKMTVVITICPVLGLMLVLFIIVQVNKMKIKKGQPYIGNE